MGNYNVQEKVNNQNKSSNNKEVGAVQLKQNNMSDIIQRAKINPNIMAQNDAMVLQRKIGNGGLMQFFKQQGKMQEETMEENYEKLEAEDPFQMKKNDTIQRAELPENKTGMPDNLKAGVENLSGLDMSDVRVHYNSDKPAKVGALAYTQGTEIHVGPGQEKHLAHEAWHVVQQKQGRVHATMQMKGVAVNDDVGFEREADVMGERTKCLKVFDKNIYKYKQIENETQSEKKVRSKGERYQKQFTELEDYQGFPNVEHGLELNNSDPVVQMTSTWEEDISRESVKIENLQVWTDRWRAKIKEKIIDLENGEIQVENMNTWNEKRNLLIDYLINPNSRLTDIMECWDYIWINAKKNGAPSSAPQFNFVWEIINARIAAEGGHPTYLAPGPESASPNKKMPDYIPPGDTIEKEALEGENVPPRLGDSVLIKADGRTIIKSEILNKLQEKFNTYKDAQHISIYIIIRMYKRDADDPKDRISEDTIRENIPPEADMFTKTQNRRVNLFITYKNQDGFYVQSQIWHE